MVNREKIKNVLPLLLAFLGHCGGDKGGTSDNWLTTSDLQQLVAPAGITASCQSTGHIKIMWDATYETIATHLQIFRKAVATEDDFVQIDEVAVDAGIYSNAVPNNVYFKYQVKAVIRDDEGVLQYISEDFSPQSAQIKATTNCSIISDPVDENTFAPVPD